MTDLNQGRLPARREQAATNTALTPYQMDGVDAAIGAGKVDKVSVSEWALASGALSRAAFATYAAPAIGNPPTQAEVQALANALQDHSQRLGALINDLKAAGVI